MIATLIVAGFVFAGEPVSDVTECDTIMCVDTLYVGKSEIVTDTTYYRVCSLEGDLGSLKSDIKQLKRILKARRQK